MPRKEYEKCRNCDDIIKPTKSKTQVFKWIHVVGGHYCNCLRGLNFCGCARPEPKQEIVKK